MNKPITREECKIAYEEWIIEKDTDDTSSEYEKFHFYDGYSYAKKKYQQKPNTGCSNCVRIFNGSKKIITDMGEVVQEQNSKIKELENQLEKYENLCGSQDETIRTQTECIVEQNTKIKELEREIELLRLKPSTQKVANCLCCQKIKKVEEIDNKTGCCEGGCEQ